MDLIALVSDKNTEFAIRGLLSRTESLGVRNVRFNIFVHPEKDPGSLLKAHDFLRTFHRSYLPALVIFDHEGCGREDKSREELEQLVEDRLSQRSCALQRADCEELIQELVRPSPTLVS